MSDIEEIINRIERGARIVRPDKTLAGYVIEVNEWREIRAALRRAERPGVVGAGVAAVGLLPDDEADPQMQVCGAIMMPDRWSGPDRCVKEPGHIERDKDWHFGERGCAWSEEATVKDA